MPANANRANSIATKRSGMTTVVQPGTWTSIELSAGRLVDVINIHGQQVVDAWALGAASGDERLSMEHTRVHLSKLHIREGDSLWSTQRRPFLSLVKDTSGGHHDTLLAACDARRYELLGHPGGHANCADNFREAMTALGRPVNDVPSPLNLFERVAYESSTGELSIVAPTLTPGSVLTLRADVDLTLVLSVCPQDMVPTNGQGMSPREIGVRVH